MTGFALFLVYALRRDGHPLGEIQNAVLLMTVLFQNVYVLCMRSERRSIFREPLFSNPWLLLGIGIAVALQLVAMFWPPLGGVLGTSPGHDADALVLSRRDGVDGRRDRSDQADCGALAAPHPTWLIERQAPSSPRS
ncbi:cation-translocating P-type ATPase C-terminal domain-containing protein [Sphingomonas sp. Ant20]|uniref:cation transporting ATPase C-terminal domain-containing protein n=1 Tax=Sphingomonas sp. Ant20 TaxID=104605 RepID=UPI00068CB026|nr:cation-translocating P-type ATPase C-terminal domain-containing protein [Sphingomonas sp. Ant20]